MSLRSKTFVFLLAALLSLGAVGDAFARAGGGFSMGSRGSFTYSAPHSSFGGAPIQRSITPRPGYQPGYGAPAFGGGLFGGGFGRGLIGGFLGAGLFGLLFGHGLFGGLGGGSSLIGLLLQIGLIYLLIRFVMGFFRNREMAYGGPQAGPQGSSYVGGGPQPFGYGGGAAGTTPIAIGPDDYNSFEHRLVDVQAAYSDENLDRLRLVATPEMVGYFNEELAGNARRGVVNRISGTRLVKGDLAEAWREGGAEYATVALRFALIDTMVDRASGRIISGDPNVPEEVAELWTFVRPAGSGAEGWKLSAIQQEQ